MTKRMTDEELAREARRWDEGASPKEWIDTPEAIPRANKNHELKCWPAPFQAIIDGRKRFEYRPDDRGFAVDDILFLREWDEASREYTGRTISMWVSYLARGVHGIPDGFCVMSIVTAQEFIVLKDRHGPT